MIYANKIEIITSPCVKCESMYEIGAYPFCFFSVSGLLKLPYLYDGTPPSDDRTSRSDLSSEDFWRLHGNQSLDDLPYSWIRSDMIDFLNEPYLLEYKS